MALSPKAKACTAPPSTSFSGDGRTISPVIGSLVTAAVRPTPEEPLPVVYTARGEMLVTYRSSCDLATPGSPAQQCTYVGVWVGTTFDSYGSLRHLSIP